MTTTKKPSNVIDVSSPTANMYGCEPCPECGNDMRWPETRSGRTVIYCENSDPSCGYTEEGKVTE